MNKLLSRDDFRNAVFKRDGYRCVVCGNQAVDAHHIMERRLFSDGGYYLDNGASVCGQCHIKCEKTNISVEQLREKIGIKHPILPPHLYSDQCYDKWGNIILPNGQRLKGELFYDENVQKILKDYLHVFTKYVKYPRTYHLPWSENMNDDDRMLDNLDSFIDKEVVVTIKKDGENSTLYNDYIHARSIDSKNHPSRNWLKNFWSSFAYEIPDGWRICGENLYAEHSIHYDNLRSYFMGFSIWNDKNICLSWDDTLEWFTLLNICPVEEIYRGVFNQELIRNLKIDTSKEEGYVVRLTESFSYGEFRFKVGKYVRKNHIQTVKHWMNGQPIIPNELLK